VEHAIELIYGAGQSICSAALLAEQEAQRFIRHFWDLSDAATPDFWPHECSRPTCRASTELITEAILLQADGTGMVVQWQIVFVIHDLHSLCGRKAKPTQGEGKINTRPAQAVMMRLLAQHHRNLAEVV